MARLSEKEKRDFVVQVITILNDEAAELTAAGYDPSIRLADLKVKSEEAALAEVAQMMARAEATKATRISNEKLALAYQDASAVVSLMEGLLGKDNSLVHKLHQIRK